MTGLFAKYPELATPKRNEKGGFGNDFFNNELTLTLEDFRVRAYYDPQSNSTLFFFNLRRSFEKNMDWFGPQINYVSVGETRRILNILCEFEEEFEV